MYVHHMCVSVPFERHAQIQTDTPSILNQHPQHLYGSAGCPILTGWTNTPPSSTLSPQPSSLLRVKVSGDSRPCSFTSAVLHLRWEGLCSLWVSSACLQEPMLPAVFASCLSPISLLWTVLDVVVLLACWLLLAGEEGRIPKGVKERLRLLRFSNREAEPAGSCSCVGFGAGLTGSQQLEAEALNGVWTSC